MKSRKKNLERNLVGRMAVIKVRSSVGGINQIKFPLMHTVLQNGATVVEDAEALARRHRPCGVADSRWRRRRGDARWCWSLFDDVGLAVASEHTGE